MFLEALIPTQGLGNYSLWAKLGLLPGGVNKGSGDHTHDPLMLGLHRSSRVDGSRQAPHDPQSFGTHWLSLHGKSLLTPVLEE